MLLRLLMFPEVLEAPEVLEVPETAEVLEARRQRKKSSVGLGYEVRTLTFSSQLRKMFASARMALFFGPILGLARALRLSLLSSFTLALAKGLESLHLRGHNRKLLCNVI